MAEIPKIHLAPQALFEIGPLGVTNTMIATVGISILLIIIALLIRRNAGITPSRAQVAFELVFEYIWDKVEIAFGSQERARKFFPLLFTIFLFLLIANQFSFLPLIESITVNGEIDLTRIPASDYSLPIALTILVLSLAHILAFTTAPLRHIGNFIKIKPFFQMKSIKELPMVLLEFFLGLLDIVGEFAKLISLATRLFGNIFAGMVIVLIISSLTVFTRYLVPIPFLVLGTLSGIVQAFVFAMLSTVFISSTTHAVSKNHAT